MCSANKHLLEDYPFDDMASTLVSKKPRAMLNKVIFCDVQQFTRCARMHANNWLIWRAETSVTRRV
jgi:hypothetical protein